MNIKAAKFYVCPETGHPFATKQQAIDSALRAIKAREEEEEANKQEEEHARLVAEAEEKKEFQINYFRLNLADIDDMPKLMESKAKEFWGLDLSVDLKSRPFFCQVSNSHYAPIGKKENWSGLKKDEPTSYLGWSGTISATIKEFKKYHPIHDIFKFHDSVAVYDILKVCFKGLHFSSGKCGGFERGKGELNMGFKMFLIDFPKLNELHNIFLLNTENFVDYKTRESDCLKKAVEFAEDQSNSKVEKKQIEQYTRALELARLKHKKIIEAYIAAYEKNHPIEPADIIGDFEKQKKIFNNTFYGY